MKKVTSGYICREFIKQDKDTVLRKLNLRNFIKAYNVEHTISQSNWLIDFDDFMKKINPNNIQKNYPQPKLRTKISAQNEWNRSHKVKIKHHIIDCICDAGNVTVKKHGRNNIINFCELEIELKKELKNKRKLPK